MAIPSQIFPSTPLFHSIDRTWHSQNGITLTFLPENETDAHSHVAGLMPFLKETADPWFMRLFSEEAKLHHVTSRWDTKTWQEFSAEKTELDCFLEDDDEFNFTGDKHEQSGNNTPEVTIQKMSELESFPLLYKDTDSESTFHPSPPSDKSIDTNPSMSSLPIPWVKLHLQNKIQFQKSPRLIQGFHCWNINSSHFKKGWKTLSGKVRRTTNPTQKH